MAENFEQKNREEASPEVAEVSLLERFGAEQYRSKMVYDAIEASEAKNTEQQAEKERISKIAKECHDWNEAIYEKKSKADFSPSDLYAVRENYAKIQKALAIEGNESAEVALYKKQLAATFAKQGLRLPHFERVVFSSNKTIQDKPIDAVVEGEVLTLSLQNTQGLKGKLLLEDLLPTNVEKISYNGREYSKKNGRFMAEGVEFSPAYTRDGETITVLQVAASQSAEERQNSEGAREKQMLDTRSEETVKTIKEAIVDGKDPSSLTADIHDIDSFVGAFKKIFSALFSNFSGIWDALKGFFGKDGNLELGKSGLGGKFRDALFSDKVSLSSIASTGIEYSESGTTLCSWTVVRTCSELFGIELPRGNAYDVRDQYAAGTLDNAKQYIDGGDAFGKYEGSANLFDIFTTSSSQYGHRILGFRKGDDIYVLDPYTTKSNAPLLLSEYTAQTERQVVGVAFYEMPKNIV